MGVGEDVLDEQVRLAAVLEGEEAGSKVIFMLDFFQEINYMFTYVQEAAHVSFLSGVQQVNVIQFHHFL